MPLTRRIPKRGFTNIYAKEYATVNVGSLEIFEDGTVVTVALLKEAGLVKQVLDGVKILGGGELTKKLTVQVTKYTQSAKDRGRRRESRGDLKCGKRCVTHGRSKNSVKS